MRVGCRWYTSWVTFLGVPCCGAHSIILQFFPETRGLELEAIDHIFEKGGITGGVWESRGRTVVGNPVAEVVEAEMNEKDIRLDDGKV